jgi:hypothetical protein
MNFNFDDLLSPNSNTSVSQQAPANPFGGGGSVSLDSAPFDSPNVVSSTPQQTNSYNKAKSGNEYLYMGPTYVHANMRTGFNVNVATRESNGTTYANITVYLANIVSNGGTYYAGKMDTPYSVNLSDTFVEEFIHFYDVVYPAFLSNHGTHPEAVYKLFNRQRAIKEEALSNQFNPFGIMVGKEKESGLPVLWVKFGPESDTKMMMTSIGFLFSLRHACEVYRSHKK